MIVRYVTLPRPLQYCALILICSCILGAVLLYGIMTDPHFGFSFSVFVVMMIILHLFVTVGLVSKKRWGLAIFKAYLYLLLIGIPVGTYIAKRTLKYIKHNEIDKLYT